MKARIVFVPRALRGHAVEVTFLAGGRDYRVSTVGGLDGHSHALVLSLKSSRATAMAQWREEVNACERCYLKKHPEERNKPTTEPFLTEWLALHKRHLKALRDGKKDPLRLCDAVSLADAKYAVYRREISAAAETTLRRLRKGVVRVTAKGKK